MPKSTITREWNADFPEGPWMDGFANELAARVFVENEPSHEVSFRLVANWFEVCDKMYNDAGKPMNPDAFNSAVQVADIRLLWEYHVE